MSGKFTITYTITIIGDRFANAAADIKAKRFWCSGGRVVPGDAKSLALVNRRKPRLFTPHDKFRVYMVFLTDVCSSDLLLGLRFKASIALTSPRKPTQVDEERILRPAGEALLRNSAK